MMLSALNSRKVFISLVLAALLVIAVYAASFLPTADWFDTFDPAARGVFSGQSPYDLISFANPPWAVIPLLPIVLLPPFYAHGLMFVVCFLLLGLIAYRLNASPITIVVFFLSPTTIGMLLGNNIDPIVVSGMLFPPMLGLFFLVMKPQIGFGVVLYYFISLWKDHGFWKVVRELGPLCITWILSMLLFPAWIDRMLFNGPQFAWNSSSFPYLIPLGLFFLWLAFRHRNPFFALASSLFFAPYHTFYSYVGLQIGLMHPDVEKYVRRDVLQLFLTILFWVVKYIFKL